MTKRHKEEDTFTVVDKRRLGEADCEEIQIQALSEHFPKAAVAEQVAKLITDLPRSYSNPTPLGENVLVKQNAAATTYRGTKFIIPDVVQQAPNMGIVVAVGPKIEADVMKPGDLVTFGRYNAEPIDVDGEQYQLVSIHDVKLRQEVTFAVGRNAN